MHPYSFLGWFVVARMTRTKVVALSIGYEHLNTRLGKSFCRWALSMRITDPFAIGTLATPWRLGLKGSNPVFPDQGFAVLDLLDCDRLQCAGKKREQTHAGLTVGVSPIVKNYCVSEGKDGSWHNRYMENLSAFLSWLIQKGHRIAFCPTDGHDSPCVQEILERITAVCPT